MFNQQEGNKQNKGEVFNIPLTLSVEELFSRILSWLLEQKINHRFTRSDDEFLLQVQPIAANLAQAITQVEEEQQGERSSVATHNGETSNSTAPRDSTQVVRSLDAVEEVAPEVNPEDFPFEHSHAHSLVVNEASGSNSESASHSGVDQTTVITPQEAALIVVAQPTPSLVVNNNIITPVVQLIAPAIQAGQTDPGTSYCTRCGKYQVYKLESRTYSNGNTILRKRCAVDGTLMAN